MQWHRRPGSGSQDDHKPTPCSTELKEFCWTWASINWDSQEWSFWPITYAVNWSSWLSLVERSTSAWYWFLVVKHLSTTSPMAGLRQLRSQDSELYVCDSNTSCDSLLDRRYPSMQNYFGRWQRVLSSQPSSLSNDGTYYSRGLVYLWSNLMWSFLKNFVHLYQQYGPFFRFAYLMDPSKSVWRLSLSCKLTNVRFALLN